MVIAVLILIEQACRHMMCVVLVTNDSGIGSLTCNEDLVSLAVSGRITCVSLSSSRVVVSVRSCVRLE